jgi:hypothetical protein
MGTLCRMLSLGSICHDENRKSELGLSRKPIMQFTGMRSYMTIDACTPLKLIGNRRRRRNFPVYVLFFLQDDDVV